MLAIGVTSASVDLGLEPLARRPRPDSVGRSADASHRPQR